MSTRQFRIEKALSRAEIASAGSAITFGAFAAAMPECATLNDAKPSDTKDVPGRAFAEAVHSLAVGSAPIDGEAVVSPMTEWSDFHALLTRQGGEAAALVGFDLLRLNGEDLRQRPLEARRQALERLVAKRRGDGILFNEALADEGSVVFVKACDLGLEGIVSKRAGSFYRNGRSRNWLKTKNPYFIRT
jgi:ATP-dependent DNA ligase